jgi:hypothetical protein
MLPRSIGEYRVAERDRNFVQALYIAEAGTEEAIRQLKINPSYNPSPVYTSFGNGGYTISVNASGLPWDKRKIISIGEVPNNNPNSYGYQKVTLEAYVDFEQKPLFAHATFSTLDTDLNNSLAIDSYDSSLGAYGGDNIGSEGNIATNAITTGAITLNDSASVSGSATVGVGGNPDTAISLKGSSSISGAKQAAWETFQLPWLPIAPRFVVNSINIKGTTTLSLPAGTYWYTGISIKESAQVRLGGPATLNSIGDIDIGGAGITTYNNLPSNLRINAVNSSPSVKVEYKSNQNFYGCIYAPNNKIKVSGSGQIFGSLVGKQIEAGDTAKIHYDAALQHAGGGVGFNINDISWRQQ